MRQSLLLAAFASLALAPLALADEGFVPIFDGKTFNGWKASEGGKSWTIEDGALTGRGDRGHVFYVQDELDDFELKVDVKINKGGNSGIYFHTKYQEEGWPDAGHEIQVNNTHTDPVKTGSLYSVVKLYESAGKDNEWFTMHIAVKGDNLRVTVAGKLVLDYTQPPGVTIPRRIDRGTIAFQQHDPKSVVQYRNILLKKLN